MMWPMVRLFYRLAMPRFALALGAIAFAVGWMVYHGPWAVSGGLGGAARLQLGVLSAVLIVVMPLVAVTQARAWPLLLPVSRRTAYAAMHVGVLAAVLPGVLLAAWWSGWGHPLRVGAAANLGVYQVVGSVLVVFAALALLPGLWTWHPLGAGIAGYLAFLITVGLAVVGHVFALALAAPIYWLGRRWFVQFDACGPDSDAGAGAGSEGVGQAEEVGGLYDRLPGAVRLLAGVVWLRLMYVFVLIWLFALGGMAAMQPQWLILIFVVAVASMAGLRSQLHRLQPLRREVVYHAACTPAIVLLLAAAVVGVAIHQGSAWPERLDSFSGVNSYAAPAERDRMRRSPEEERDLRRAWWQERASLVAQSVANEHANRYGLMWDAEDLVGVDRWGDLVVTTEHLQAEVLAAGRWRRWCWRWRGCGWGWAASGCTGTGGW